MCIRDRNYTEYKPIHDELKKLQNGWTNKRDKYEEAHRAELALWDAANRYLHAKLPKETKTLPIAEWEQEYSDIKTQRDTDYTKLKAARAEVAELQKIRKCVDIAPVSYTHLCRKKLKIVQSIWQSAPRN